LLPFGDEFALVWTCTPEEASALVSLADDPFLKRLQDVFGDRAGRFCEVRQRSMFPLILRVSRPPSNTGIVLLGNAAQTLHPIAAQGFNLGLRDAWDLADIFRTTTFPDVGIRELTARFRSQRRFDRIEKIAFTDSLVRLFSIDLGPIGIGRGVGLALLDSVPLLKRNMMRRMIFGF
jgi:2-octaprenyl-6-methoxyphenol hydroxylase